MKKIYLWGILVLIGLSLAACKGKPKQVIYKNTPINNDKNIYKNEIPRVNTNKPAKESDSETTKQEETKQVIKEEPQKQVTPVHPSKYDPLSSQKYGWGIKRNNNHNVPEVYKSTQDLFKKYDAIYTGDTSKKVIYLTFDEGYENGYTPKILDTLKENNVKAAFFVTGPYVSKQGDLVRRMLDEGHIVGNHTINHPSLPTIGVEKVENELLGLDKLYYDKFKVNFKFMRPPMGEYSERVLAQAKDLGYVTTMWSFAYLDYDVNNQKGTDYAYKTIMDNLHNGEIMLLHAVSKDNANVLDRIIKDIKAQGYEFGTLDSINLN